MSAGGIMRMVRAGATPMTWVATIAEWCPDNASAEYARLYPIVIEHGGGLGLATEYVFAQIESGRVPAPGAKGAGPGPGGAV
ncbi:MAG TPA: hypothetical protein VFS43_42290 [Polyangiaceae bacterium]|nr:hypothetical protein [Polyangiaceae bacterium]